MNKTMQKFGYPDTLVREYQSWVVLLRPQQATLGALVLVCKESAETLSGVSARAFAELKEITTAIESCLKSCFNYDKVNYLLLMMVDPDVHFHILPRYSAVRIFCQTEFTDPGWPGPPELGRTNQVAEIVKQQMLDSLKKAIDNDSVGAD